MKILFFSNPLGWGHVTRDMRLAKIILKILPNCEIAFSSSGTALDLLRDEGWSASGSKEMEKMLSDRIERIASAIHSQKPDIVISDEELMALPLAKVMADIPLPTILISDYLPSNISPYSMPLNNEQELAFFKQADSIVIPDFIEGYEVNEILRGKVNFIGPIIDQIEEQNKIPPKNEMRESYGIRNDEKVFVVTAGDRVSQGRDLFSAAISAFKLLRVPTKRLIVLAGNRKDEIAKEFHGDDKILVLGHAYPAAKIWFSADLVINRGGHTTLWELAASGTPSLSVPFPPQINQLNLFFTRKMEREGTTMVIQEHELTVPYLSLCMERAILLGQSEFPKIRQRIIEAESQQLEKIQAILKPYLAPASGFIGH